MKVIHIFIGNLLSIKKKFYQSLQRTSESMFFNLFSLFLIQRTKNHCPILIQKMDNAFMDNLTTFFAGIFDY